MAFLGLVVVMLVLAGCAAATPQPTATPVPPTATSVPPAPTVAVTMPSLPAMLKVAQKDGFGQFLVDDKGMSLYLFVTDTKDTSNCYDQCAKSWPPLLTKGAPVAGEGVNAPLLGMTQRKDSTSQVTYNGWPLYYFVNDKAAGDMKGQGVKDVWYVISPIGAKLEAAMVKIGQQDSLGKFLTDDEGRTLYLFLKDTKDTSNCYDQCAINWPPLLTAGAPVAGESVTASLLGTTQRKDGTSQATYNGWPLYCYITDKAAGDTTGQGVGKVWYVLSPAGEQIG